MLLFLLFVAVGLVAGEVLRNQQALCRRPGQGALTVPTSGMTIVAFWWHSQFLSSAPTVSCNNFTHAMMELTQNCSFENCACGWYFVASLSDQWARQPKYHSEINPCYWLCCCSCCLWLSGLWPGRYLGTNGPCAEDPVCRACGQGGT